jgi:hypothetical protein
MNFIKKLLADSLHGIDLTDLPFIAFRLFMAALLVYAIRLLLAKKINLADEMKKWMIAISSFAAFVAIVSEVSVEVAILFVPVLLVMIPFKKDWSYSNQIVLALSLGLGLACGAGYVFLAVLITAVLVPMILLANKA